MTKDMNAVASSEQETYVKVEFPEREEIAVRYQRLLKEFDTKFEERLSMLTQDSANQLQSDMDLGKSDAEKNHQQREQYLNDYKKRTADLRNLILSLSNVDKSRGFFSRQFSKQYVGYEFFSEAGYPNDKFRIELLARAIKAIDDPNDAENQKQLSLIHTILPEETSKKLPVLLTVAAFVFAGVAIAGVMLGAGAAPIIPIAIGMTMFAVGFSGSILAMYGAPVVQERQEIYKKYKDEISNIPKNLQFFTQSEMEKNTTPKKDEDSRESSPAATLQNAN